MYGNSGAQNGKARGEMLQFAQQENLTTLQVPPNRSASFVCHVLLSIADEVHRFRSSTNCLSLFFLCAQIGADFIRLYLGVRDMSIPFLPEALWKAAAGNSTKCS